MGPVPVSRKKAAPEGGKDTSAHGIIAYFWTHVECNGQDLQQFSSNKNTVRDTMFLKQVGIFSYRTIGREERLG